MAVSRSKVTEKLISPELGTEPWEMHWEILSLGESGHGEGNRFYLCLRSGEDSMVDLEVWIQYITSVQNLYFQLFSTLKQTTYIVAEVSVKQVCTVCHTVILEASLKECFSTLKMWSNYTIYGDWLDLQQSDWIWLSNC